MKIAIVGSRQFVCEHPPKEVFVSKGKEYSIPCLCLHRKMVDKLRDFVQSLPEDTIIVTGGAPGVDSLAENFAKHRGLQVIVFKPLWKKFGKAAGFIRNKEIVDSADRVVAFWDGKSHGTANSIKLAEDAGKSLEVIKIAS